MIEYRPKPTDLPFRDGCTDPLSGGMPCVLVFFASSREKENFRFTSSIRQEQWQRTSRNYTIDCGAERAILPSEHRPDVGEEGIVAAGVSSHTIDIRRGPVEFVPVRILQADAEIKPRPKLWAAAAEWQIGKLEDVAGAVRASGEGAVKRLHR